MWCLRNSGIFAVHQQDALGRRAQQHYRLTDEELDFTVNYDIKNRMRLDAENDGGDS